MSFSSIAVIILIIAGTVFGLLGIFSRGEEGRVDVVWACVAVLILGLTLILCVFGADGPILVKTDSEPADTVTGFFDALKAEDYNAAYAYLKDYSGLGLEKEADDEATALMLDALTESYSYTLLGKSAVDKLKATQRVRFTYLDLNAMLEAVVPAEEEDELAALRRISANAEAYYKSIETIISLEFFDGSWLMNMNPELLAALGGGLE